MLLRELTRTAEGAGQIAEGAGRAHREVTSILTDPVGRHAPSTICSSTTRPSRSIPSCSAASPPISRPTAIGPAST